MAYNPKFQINLSQVFSRAFGSMPSKARDQLRPTLKLGVFRATFGKMVMDRIIERTLSGIDRDGVRFVAYSKVYRNSDVFKIYQKSPGEVNLKLTGEMLASLTARGTGPLLSVELLGADNQAKAHGHVYGLGKKKVKRDFLGLPTKELDELMVEAMKIARNDAYQAASEFYENTSLADLFGQVGAQPEIGVNVFTNEVLQMLAREVIE